MPLTSLYIAAKIATLRQQYPHAGDFCFFTDISNLPAIFSSGRLLPRSVVVANGALQHDCASSTVLDKTPPWVHERVRLYYAPATPMLYQIEGIKRSQDNWPECPQPAYLVFDPQILTINGAWVSNGNMGSNYSSAAEATDSYFDTLPFEGIYHRGPLQKNQEAVAVHGFDPAVKDATRKRQAEVLIPNELPLTWLRRMVFRSQAEQDFALTLIGYAPQGIPLEVNKDWFLAGTRHRPHLDTLTQKNGGNFTFQVANRMQGDRVVIIRHAAGGQLRAFSMTAHLTGWNPWEEVPVGSLGFDLPAPGRQRLYLLGHVVADLEYRGG